MKKLVLMAAVAATVVIFPTAAPAAHAFSGVVVGKSRGALAVATRSGAVTTSMLKPVIWPKVSMATTFNGSASATVSV